MMNIFRRLLNVCTLLILVGTCIGSYEALTSSNIIYELYRAVGIGLLLLILIAALNYILFNKPTVFHK